MAIFSILAVSCTKENVKIEKVDYSQPIQLRSDVITTDFARFESELLSFWTKGLEEYSLETFCSCDCDGVLASQDLLNKHYDLMPSIFVNYQEIDFSCEELRSFMSYDCEYNTIESYDEFITSALTENLSSVQKAITTEGERTLVLDLLDDIKNNTLDIPSYRERWYNLTEKSSIENSYSALIIEIANSGYIFVDTFGFDNEDDDIQELWNKVGGAVFGAFAGVLLDGMFDSAYDDGHVSEGQFWQAAAKGAISGAVRSL